MTPLLTVSHVSKHYGKRRVLRGVAFEIESSEVVGIIGPNGAGKTTLLRMIVGLQRCDEGRVLWRGRQASGSGAVRIAYFGGEQTVPPAVRTRRWRALFHEVESKAEDRPVRELSRGSRQLFGLRTLFTLPSLHCIALDEPWEGLDPDAARWLSEAIRARRAGGAAVLVSSHRLHDLAGVCDRFVFLDNGVSTTLPASAIGDDGPLTGDALLTRFDALRGGRR